jgi:hypothetical protein
MQGRKTPRIVMSALQPEARIARPAGRKTLSVRFNFAATQFM